MDHFEINNRSVEIDTETTILSIDISIYDCVMVSKVDKNKEIFRVYISSPRYQMTKDPVYEGTKEDCIKLYKLMTRARWGK